MKCWFPQYDRTIKIDVHKNEWVNVNELFNAGEQIAARRVDKIVHRKG